MPRIPSDQSPTTGSEEDRLYRELLALPDLARREEFLARLGARQPALRQRLEDLLRASEETQPTPVEPGPPRASSPHRGIEGPGSQIGRYRLLERIGEGGMGVVYLAESTGEYYQRVALKIIKPGLDTRQVVARFEAERQALALMSHPNVAKVLDGGTTEAGRPYFVMELVKGVPITEFCDQQHFSTPERLELFRQVCEGVHHAHQKGIIHRDLKPSNILVSLVDGKPHPVIIDFGVAKAINQRLTEKTIFTRDGQFLGTPAYVSPEQARAKGLDIDIRADVYSLGVLLYELLIGKTPFDKQTLLSKGFEEIYRIISEVDPLKPSTRLSTMSGDELTTLARCRRIDVRRLGRILRGDMDWIVMKAIEKDRNRRYDSATSLASDVERFLRGEPVTAVAPSRLYQLQKFIRRNQRTVAVLTALFVSLTAGLAGTTWQARQAARARDAAQAATREAEEVIRFLEGMLEEVRPARALGQDTTLLRRILDLSARRAGRELDSQPAVSVRLNLTMGRTFEAIGEYASAEQRQREALRVARSALGPASPAAAAALADLGRTLHLKGDTAAAETALREALALSLAGPARDSRREALARHRLGTLWLDLGRLEEAADSLTRARELELKLLPADDPLTLSTAMELSALYFRQDRLAEMEAVVTPAVNALRQAAQPADPTLLHAVGLQALLRQNQGRFEEAAALHREVLDARRRILSPGHDYTLAALDNLALVRGYQGFQTEAEALAREAWTGLAARLGPTNRVTLASESNVAEYVRNQGRYGESEALFRRLLALQATVLAPDDPNRMETLGGLALQYLWQGRTSEAEPLAQSLVEGRVRTDGTNSPAHADALSLLSRVWLAQGRAREAEPPARQALAIRERGRPDDWRRFAAQGELGACLLAAGQATEGARQLEAGYRQLHQVRNRLPAMERKRLLDLGLRFSQDLESSGRTADAEAVRRELDELRAWVPAIP